MINDKGSQPYPRGHYYQRHRNPPCLDYATLFKTLKDLVDNEIKPAIEGQFTALQNMFIQRMKNIIHQRMQVLSYTQAEMMHQVVDQIIQDQARLRRQVTDLSREVQSTLVAKAAPTSTPSTTVTPLPLISYPEVVVGAADRQSLKQQTAGKLTPLPMNAPQVPHPATAPTPALINLEPPARPSIVVIAASGVSTLPVKQWTAIFRKGKTIPEVVLLTSKRSKLLKRSMAAEHRGTAKEPTKTEHQIFFPRRAGASSKNRREALNIAHQLNRKLSAAKVPNYIYIHQLN